MRLRFLSRAVPVGLLLCLAVTVACSGGTDVATRGLSWDELRATYEYDASDPLMPVVEQVEQTEFYRIEQITFKAIDGTDIPAVLYVPQTANADPAPCILLMHGYGGDKDAYAAVLAPFVAPLGIAVMSIDARMHGERAVPGEKMFSSDVQRTHDAMVNTVIDNRRALDYLDTRADIDHDRYLCMGLSMGAILGSVLGPVDERVRSASLIVGGGRLDVLVMESDLPDVQRMREAGVTPEVLAEHLAEVEPTHFIGHFAPRPVQMVNGRADAVVIPECAAYLHKAANEPKEIIWYEGGHVPSPAVIFMSVGPFIREQLIEQGG